MFVHYSDIHGDVYRTLKDGDLGEYEIVHGANGQHAANVVVTDS